MVTETLLDGWVTFWDLMANYRKSHRTWKIEREAYRCYMIWQREGYMPHCSEHLKIGRMVMQWNDVRNLLYSQPCVKRFLVKTVGLLCTFEYRCAWRSSRQRTLSGWSRQGSTSVRTTTSVLSPSVTLTPSIRTSFLVAQIVLSSPHSLTGNLFSVRYNYLPVTRPFCNK